MNMPEDMVLGAYQLNFLEEFSTTNIFLFFSQILNSLRWSMRYEYIRINGYLTPHMYAILALTHRESPI